jgi:hypothetical protein
LTDILTFCKILLEGRECWFVMNKIEHIRKVVIEYEDPVFGMNVVCRLVRIPEWTLRMLDKNNIVRPHKSKGNTRLYSQHDLERLSYIQRLMEENDMDIRGLKLLSKVSALLER